MTIASVGTAGIAVSIVSETSWASSFSIGGMGAGEYMVVVISSDNINTTDGDFNEHGFSGEGLAWFKLGEYTNGNGAAAAGCTVSAWVAHNPGAAIGAPFNFTATFTSAVVDKTASAWVFSSTTNLLGLTPVTLQSNATDGSTGFGSSVISGLPSVERLYFRALSKEANSTAQITASSGFTAITVTRSQNSADAMLVRGEFIIATSTGETSNPTFAVSGDTAGLFFALSEGEPSAGYAPAHRALLLNA